MSDLATVFCRRVEFFLAKKNMSRADLARNLGWQPQRVTNFLNAPAQANPSLKTMEQIAKALGLGSPVLLLTADDAVDVDTAKLVLRKHFAKALRSKKGKRLAADLRDVLLYHVGEE